MSVEDFHAQVASRWADAIASLNLEGATSVTRRGRTEIMKTLEPFMGRGVNHAHLPTGGGLDYHSVLPGPGAECLTFPTGGRSMDIVKPGTLQIEVFPERLQESFLLLTLDPLDVVDTGAHEDRLSFARRHGRQELVDLGGGDYRDREVWDAGYVGYDEYDNEIPLPEEARLVGRYLRGSILFVAKGSMWNGTPGTYGGMHARMTAEEIRAMIQSALTKRTS